MNPFVTLVASIISIIFLSAAIRKMAERVFPSRLFPILFFSGVVLHETFHAAASLLVGAKVHKINFFSLSGGSVLHEKAKVPFGQLFISLAPFIGGVALIILSSPLFFSEQAYSNPITMGFWREIGGLVSSLWFWVWAYILYSVSMTMFPSWQDIKNSLFAIIGLFLAGFFLVLSGVTAFETAWIEKGGKILLLVLPLLTLFFGASALLLVLKTVIMKGVAR